MKNILFGAVAVVALMLGAVRPSEASLMINLADDMGHSDTVMSAGGVVSFSGSVGNFGINVTTGLSKPDIGSVTIPQLDLNSVDVTSASGGKLTIEVTDTDFFGSGVGTFVSQIGGTQSAGGVLTYSTFMDCSNTPFGTGTPLSSQTIGTSPVVGEMTTITSLCGTSYSLTETVALSLPNGQEITSFDANLALPEPATLTLFGVGLIGIGLVLRRKRPS